MANVINYVGIDVSAKTLVVHCEDQHGHLAKTGEFNNNYDGHKKLAKFLTKKGMAKVCVEATGVYHLQLAIGLTKHKHCEVMVVNPREMRHFGLSIKQRGKTDAVDAKVICQYVKRMPFTVWKQPSKLWLQLQAMSRRIGQLKQDIIAEKSRSHATDFLSSCPRLVKTSQNAHIAYLEKSIVKLESKIAELIETDEQLKQYHQLLCSVKGIANTTAILLIAEIAPLIETITPEQLAAFAGLDPRAFQSGTSINKPARISKRGSVRLRSALYLPAWVAVQHDAHVKGFYEKLISRGKTKKQAIVAVMRKLLHAIWAILKHNQPWVGEKFCKI